MAGYLESDFFIKEFHNGGKEAVEAIYHRYYPDIYYFARKLVDSKEDAQDITATVMQQLVIKKKDFNSIANIKAFLYVTARNRCLNLLRHRNTIALHKKPLTEAILENYDNTNDELDILRLRKIDQCIRQLPARQREVIELLFLGDKKYKEVAAIMQISERAVTDLRRKGLTLLRELILKTEAAELVWLFILFLLSY